MLEHLYHAYNALLVVKSAILIANWVMNKVIQTYCSLTLLGPRSWHSQTQVIGSRHILLTLALYFLAKYFRSVKVKGHYKVRIFKSHLHLPFVLIHCSLHLSANIRTRQHFPELAPPCAVHSCLTLVVRDQEDSMCGMPGWQVLGYWKVNWYWMGCRSGLGLCGSDNWEPEVQKSVTIVTFPYFIFGEGAEMSAAWWSEFYCMLQGHLPDKMLQGRVRNCTRKPQFSWSPIQSDPRLQDFNLKHKNIEMPHEFQKSKPPPE